MIITRNSLDWLECFTKELFFLDVIDLSEENGTCTVTYYTGSTNISQSIRIFY